VGVLGDLLDRDREAEDPGPGAAVRLRDAEAGQAGVDEELEQVLGVLLGHVDLTGPGRHLVLGDPADGGLELLELRRQIEIHERSSLPAPGSWFWFVRCRFASAPGKWVAVRPVPTAPRRAGLPAIRPRARPA